jgi:hypothetical protein
VHAALALGLTRIAGPVQPTRPRPSHAAHVIYRSSTDENRDQLAPGDAKGFEAGPPAPGGNAFSVQLTPSGGGLGPRIGVSQDAGSSNQGFAAGSGIDGQGGAATSFFGVPARGLRIVYVIDRSASMGFGGALTVARNEVIASLARLPASASFQVVPYHSSAAVLVGVKDTLVPATPENVRLASSALETLTASLGTRHLDALLLAVRLEPDVIYFLTDADDLSENDRRLVTQANAGRSIIHTIELTLANVGHPDRPMQRLAHDNRGTYQAVDLRSTRGDNVTP